MLFGLLFTLPSGTDFLTAIGSTSSPVFNELLPLLYIILGILIPIFIVVIILKVFHPFGGHH